MLLALVIAVAVLLPGGNRTTSHEVTAAPAAHGAASATRAPISSADARAVLLTPTKIGQVHFGESQIQAVANLNRILGQPETAHPQPEISCDVFSFLAWRDFTAFFDHNRFVGYSTSLQSLATARNLHRGTTVAVARAIYGHAFRLSMAQGGSYRITFSSGALTGFVHGGVTATSIPPTAEVEDIGAGATGCTGIRP